MKKCNRCDIILNDPTDNNIDTRNILIDYNNEMICNACFEAISFMNDLDQPDIISESNNIKKKDKIIVKNQNKIECSNIKCKNIYLGSICPICNTKNVLFIRKKKKKKKKKKKNK